MRNDRAGDDGRPESVGWPRIPGYRLLELLGTGGMGEVYLAEQTEPVERQVALKVISGDPGDGLAGAMFEVERQILARLQHPAIAQIHDAGTTAEGRPWFAMEWVRGEPVTDYCRNQRLDRRARLALFIRICNGVEHAHRRGVIHRDLKPANILVRTVDGEPAPKIIDFGIASSLVESGGQVRAEASDRAGTRVYMSPEQRHGDPGTLDIRTDVYSLGLLLFEMLTDARPALGDEPATLGEFRDALLATRLPGTAGGARTANDEDGPDRWRRLADSLPRELRFVLARALAVAREERYGSAADLARDLRNFVENRVVSAVPETRLYRLKKFVQRHRLSVAATTAVALALVLGLAAAVWGWLEARAQRDYAREQLVRAEQASEFVTRMLDSINPQSADGADTTLLRRILDDAAERAPARLSEYPAILGEIELTLGRAYNAIGEHETALEHIHRSLELTAGNPDMRRLWLRGRNLLSYNRYLAGEDRQALRISEALFREHGLPPDDPVRLEIVSQLAAVYRVTGRPEQALDLAMEVTRQTEGATEPNLIDQRLESMRIAAQAHSDAGRLDRADTLYQQVLEEARAWNDPGARWHELAILNDRAVVLLRGQRYADAEIMLREAIERSEALFGENDRRLISAVSNLASSLRQQGKLEASLGWFDRARELVVTNFGPEHPNLIILDHNQGNAYRELGRLETALGLQRSALERALERMAERPAALAEFRLGLGQTELAAGNLERARRLLAASLSHFAEVRGPDHYKTRAAAQALAEVHARAGDPGAAAQLRRTYNVPQVQ